MTGLFPHFWLNEFWRGKVGVLCPFLAERRSWAAPEGH